MELQMDLPAMRPPRPTGPTQGSSPQCGLKRPSVHDETILADAARAIAARCLLWDSEGTVDQWEPSVLACRSDWHDGYKFARALERGHLVDPDAELVQILDGSLGELAERHDMAVRRWVGIVGFRPLFSIGDVVSAGRHGHGPIHSIDYGLARYAVDVRGTGTGGVLIEAEDVERYEPACI